MTAPATAFHSLQVQAKIFIAALLLAAALFSIPAPAQASSLTGSQVEAIIGLLVSFGADQTIIDNVNIVLGGQTSGGVVITAEQQPVNSLVPLFEEGNRVVVTNNLTVRAAPSTSGTAIGIQPRGNIGVITGGPTSANGYIWWRVNWNTGPDGWSVQDYMQKTRGEVVYSFISAPAFGPSPLTVEFSVTGDISNMLSIDFGDGTSASCSSDHCSSSSLWRYSHTYTTPGTFETKLLGSDPSSCNEAGTICTADLSQRRILGIATINVLATVEIPTPVFKTFSLHPTSIKEGESSTLVWNVANAKKCILKASDGTEIKDLIWVGSRMLAPTRTMTYTLQCINNDLFGNDSPAVSRSVTITVMPGAVTDFSANITGGTVPLPVAFTYRLNVASSCSAGYYFLSFGDENWAAGDVQQKVSWNAGACAPITQTITHTYTTPGIYLAQLNNPGIALLGSAKITVATGVAVTATVTLPGTTADDIVVADANSGTAPFPVTFSFLLNRTASCAEGAYNIYFGDENWGAGDTATRATWGANSCAKSIQTLTHTYTQKGIYKMQIFDTSSGAGVFAGSETITVLSAPSASAQFDYVSAYSSAFNSHLAAVATVIIMTPLDIVTDVLSDLFFAAGIY